MSEAQPCQRRAMLKRDLGIAALMCLTGNTLTAQVGQGIAKAQATARTKRDDFRQSRSMRDAGLIETSRASHAIS
jgi:hypothetical protein